MAIIRLAPRRRQAILINVRVLSYSLSELARIITKSRRQGQGFFRGFISVRYLRRGMAVRGNGVEKNCAASRIFGVNFGGDASAVASRILNVRRSTPIRRPYSHAVSVNCGVLPPAAASRRVVLKVSVRRISCGHFAGTPKSRRAIN